MDVLGWKQLALWSLEHSEMRPEERSQALAEYNIEWRKFCHWVIATYGDHYRTKSIDIA